MAKGTEEICIRKIESGIRAIKNNTKTIKEANCGFLFKTLKSLNEGMYDELLLKYIEVTKNKEE
jgi:hypothetical protein